MAVPKLVMKELQDAGIHTMEERDSDGDKNFYRLFSEEEENVISNAFEEMKSNVIRDQHKIRH